MQKTNLFLICLFPLLIETFFLQAQPAASTTSKDLRVGAAAIKITPTVGGIIGNSYGITVSEGVHDDTYAKVLVFEKDGIKAAFMALDFISLPHSVVMRTRELVAQSTGIPITNIIMSATHAHSGPQMNPLFWESVGGAPKQKSEEYVKNLPGMLAKGVQAAEAKLQPVNVSVGTIQENTISFNRRFLMKDGSFKTNPGKVNPNTIRVAGPIDPNVSMIYFESSDSKKPVAMLVNFAVHAAIVTGNQIAADFPGVVSALMAKVKGDEMVTVFTQGTSGNVNHVDVTKPNQLSGYAESNRVGTILAADVMKALPNLRPIEINFLKARTMPVDVPIPTVKPEEITWAKQIMARYGKKTDASSFSDVVKASRLLDLVELKAGLQGRHETTSTVPLTENGKALRSEVQAIVLGDQVALVGFPGDAFVELGLAIKGNSPFPFTVVNEQSGNGTISYMPNRKAFPEGGYEVESARYLPGGGELLVDAAVKVLVSLFPY